MYRAVSVLLSSMVSETVILLEQSVVVKLKMNENRIDFMSPCWQIIIDNVLKTTACRESKAIQEKME